MEEQTETGWLLLGLRSLFEEKRHCDIDICVGKETFTCHKVILSAASKYFDAMFSSGMQESTAKIVRLNDIDESTFADLLKIIYTGSDAISTENVESMLHAACLLQIVHVQQLCEQFLIGQITKDNVIGFWCISTTLHCAELEQVTWNFILKNFECIVENEEFLKLEKNDFVKILSDDDLVVTSEETVCSAAMRWMKERETERRDTFYDILSQLKLAHVSLDYLLENIYTDPHIHTDPECMKLLKGAVKYHALPEKRHMYDYTNVTVRNNSDMSSVYMVLARRQTVDAFSTGTTDILAYDAMKRKWVTFCPLPFDIGEEFATCAYGNDVYASGGTTKPESFVKFSAKQYTWIKMPDMYLGRYRHCMLAMKESIFCVGGYNFGTVGSVEEFDISANTWQTVGKLKHAVDAASAVVYEDNILVFGGWEGFSDETSAIQCFNTKTNTCTVIGNLPSPLKESRALSFNDTIYIVLSTGQIMQYKPFKSPKLVGKVENFHRKNFGLFKDNRTLYIMGGNLLEENMAEDKTTLSDEVLTFPQGQDTEDNKGSIHGPLPAGFEVYGCYHILVKNKYPLVEFSEQFAW